MSTAALSVVPAADIHQLFQELASEWKLKSRFLSNTAQMALLEPYQKIIGMGMPAVPFILEELRREPGQWFWALRSITRQDPVPMEAAGRVNLMTQAWIDWGVRNSLIES